MASARRPPIHPNCRCTLVPYVELKDDDGNIVDADAERPAANADFDKLAQDSYNAQAKEKGWSRRWDDLSASTRLKYYYQAQKDFEKRTGKPAYRQVNSNLSFPEYFKQQPDSFKRAWLGAKRYEAYKAGNLAEKAIFAPDLAYTVSPTSLVKFVEPDVPEKLNELVKEYEKKGSPELASRSGNAVENLRLDGKTLMQAVRNSGESFKRGELEANLRRRESSEMLDGFEEQKTTRKAENFIKEKLKINADYSKLPIEVANDVNQELVRAFNMFGTVGIIENVKVDNFYVTGGRFAAFDTKTFSILLRSDRGRGAVLFAVNHLSEGELSTRSELHPYRHEIGHALLQYFKREAPERVKLVENLYREYFKNSNKGIPLLSKYAGDSCSEMVAEAFAEIMNGSPRELTKKFFQP